MDSHLPVRRQITNAQVWQLSVTRSGAHLPPNSLACGKWWQAPLSSMGAALLCTVVLGVGGLCQPATRPRHCRCGYLLDQVRGFAAHQGLSQQVTSGLAVPETQWHWADAAGKVSLYSGFPNL